MNTISKSTTALALASLMMSGLITIQSAQAQSFNLLHSFCSKADCPDGAGPVAALIQATDGNLYGTTGSGDDIGCGSVFRITTGGTLTTLASFDCSNGRNPVSALIQGLNGALYGTAAWAGTKIVPANSAVARSSESLAEISWPRCTSSMARTDSSQCPR